MAAFNYEGSADTALRLITKFGSTIQIKRPVAGTGPAHAPGAPTTVGPYDVKAVVLPAKKALLDAFAADNSLEDNSLIAAKLRTVLMAAKGMLIEPETGDIVIFDSKEWSVLGSVPLRPAEVAVIHSMGVKLI